MAKIKLGDIAKQTFADSVVFNVFHDMIGNVIEKATAEAVPDSISNKDLIEIKKIATRQLNSLVLSLRDQSKKS